MDVITINLEDGYGDPTGQELDLNHDPIEAEEPKVAVLQQLC